VFVFRTSSLLWVEEDFAKANQLSQLLFGSAWIFSGSVSSTLYGSTEWSISKKSSPKGSFQAFPRNPGFGGTFEGNKTLFITASITNGTTTNNGTFAA
jgi:hypothetical protein